MRKKASPVIANRANINDESIYVHRRNSADSNAANLQQANETIIKFSQTTINDVDAETFYSSEKKSYERICDSLESQKYHIFNKNTKPINYGTNSSTNYPKRSESLSGEDGSGEEKFGVSDIIGSFGWFQFLVLLFSGLRESSVGYDAVVMSVILQPINNFYCNNQLKSEFTLSGYANNSQEFKDNIQCFQSVDGHMLRDSSNQPIRCESWNFLPQVDGSTSLLAKWGLVCHRHWLVAFIESAYFMGLVTGNLVWGYYADKVGRRKAYITAHSVALIFGWASILAPTIWLFALCRFFSAFGSIGYNIIYTIQIEMIGSKHRSYSTLLNHLGWGLGVITVPLAHKLFSDYRFIIALAPLMALLMFPWSFWLPESSRWLMAHDKFSAARRELIRAAKFNGKKITPITERKISLLRQKVAFDRQKARHLEDSNLYSMLFKNSTLVRDTFILAYVSFIGHLFYYLLTINFGYIKNLSVDANFITSGAGEWVSVILGAILLKLSSRKICMSLFLFLTAASFAFQFLIDSELSPSLDTEFITTANNGIGTLSALVVIFVAAIVNQEVYPTIIRQTGSSVVNTIAESGSALAPLLIQFANFIGPEKADLFYTIVCLIGIFCVQHLTKTDDIELPDS